MYRINKRISDYELDRYRVSADRVKRTARRDLFDAMMAKMEEEEVSPEDFLLRFTSIRGHNPYSGWFTQYELNAVPLRDARDILGVR